MLRNAKSLAAEGAESAELVWEKGAERLPRGLACWLALTAQSHTFCDTATLEGVRDRAGHGFFMKDEKLYIHAGYDSQHNVLHDLVEVDVSPGACHYPRPRTTHRYSPLRIHQMGSLRERWSTSRCYPTWSGDGIAASFTMTATSCTEVRLPAPPPSGAP